MTEIWKVTDPMGLLAATLHAQGRGLPEVRSVLLCYENFLSIFDDHITSKDYVYKYTVYVIFLNPPFFFSPYFNH